MSLHRDHPLPQDAGTTLVEVLVAIFIMTLAAGMVAMTMRPHADPLEQAAARLEHDITAAIDLALVTGTPRGLKITDEGYQRVKWQDGAWIVMPAAVQFDRNVAFDTRRSPLAAPSPTPSDTPEILPDIILDTTGTAQAARLTLVRKGKSIDLTIAPDGKVTWEAPNA
tara:strand:- start:2012 stop:2515 length:504 start_codon:yes stop_codon:yes gene_type:complete